MRNSKYLIVLLVLSLVILSVFALPLSSEGELVPVEGEELEEISAFDVLDNEDMVIYDGSDIADLEVMDENGDSLLTAFDITADIYDTINNKVEDTVNNAVKSSLNSIKPMIEESVKQTVSESIEREKANGAFEVAINSASNRISSSSNSDMDVMLKLSMMNSILNNQANMQNAQNNNNTQIQNPEPRKGNLKSDWVFSSNLGYWFIADKNWTKVITPVIDINLYLGFPRITNGSVAFSINFGFDYRFGLGKGDYEFTFHNILLTLPFTFTAEFNKGIEASLGVGPFYQYDVMNIQKIYEDDFSTYKQNQFGLRAFLKFSYNIANRVDLAVTVNADVPLTAGSFVVISPFIGIDYKF